MDYRVTNTGMSMTEPQTRTNDLAVRIQFCNGYTLQAEVICPQSMARDLTSAYFNRKYAKHLPMGSAVEQLASLPRSWDVPIGSVIPQSARV